MAEVKDVRQALLDGTCMDEEGVDELLASLRELGLTITSDPCILKAAPGEPFFVMRGHDIVAADAVLDWYERVSDHYQRMPEHKQPGTDAKLRGAWDTAQAMRNWPRREYPG